MTETERWEWVETCLYEAIALIVNNRCYPAQSMPGARYTCMLVRREIARIDELLLELEHNEKGEVRQNEED